MVFRVVHSLPGRVRVRFARHFLDARQAALVELLLSFQDGIKRAVVNAISSSVLIEYEGMSEETALSFLKAIDDKYLKDEQLLSQTPNPAAQESLLAILLEMFAKHYLKKLFLPLFIRKIVSFLNIAPRVQRGIKAVFDGRVFCADTLDAAALSLSFATGDMNTAGSISLLLNVGETLEDYTKRKSYDSLTNSLMTADEMVQILDENGEEKTVSSSVLKKGDTLICRAPCIISADGIVLRGEASVNQASMTGESLPVHKTAGSSVFASTVVDEGEIFVTVSKAGGETRVSNIATLIDRSQEHKAASQIRAERIADRLVKYNFLLSALTFGFTRNFQKAASTLLVDYSCAMKLSAPICVLSAMRDSARRGVMVKGGKFLEELAKADTFVFDKTGTLTESTPRVTHVIPFGDLSEREVLKMAACLEEHFPHSLARAVVKEAADRGIEHSEEHARVEYILAHGIASSLGDKKLRIGSAHFIFDDEKIPKTPEVKQEIEKWSESGSSLLFFSVGETLSGIIVIDDPIRAEARETVSRLHALGVKNVVMITGDGENTAKMVAKKTGVDTYFSQALPDSKVEYIKKMQSEGHKVVMIGDGINDAPALSSANVGIAMGEASQIATQTADILLPSDGLLSLPFLREIGLQLLSRISANNAAIISINTALIALSLFGTISSTSAALFHNGSTVALSLSAMRPLLEEKSKRREK